MRNDFQDPDVGVGGIKKTNRNTTGYSNSNYMNNVKQKN